MGGFHIGADTVGLVFRDPVLDAGSPTYDSNGRPVFADRVVPKTGAKFTITSITESGSVVVYQAKCALQPDADAMALRSKDAVEHDGKVFELSGDARMKRTLIDGTEHHVRVVCTREESVSSIAERVTITPRGGQDDDGHRLPDGAPVEVEAIAVDPGNTAERYGAEGSTDEADFTVVLALGSGVRDGDWITVRGRRCVARIQREFSQHAQRDRDVVLARFRGGGG